MTTSSARPDHLSDFSREVGALDDGLRVEIASFEAAYNAFAAVPNDLSTAAGLDGGSGPPRLEHLAETGGALHHHVEHLADLRARIDAIGQAFRDADLRGANAQPFDDATIESNLVAAGRQPHATYLPMDIPTPAAAGLTVSSGWGGDPVNAASGNFVDHQVDHEAPSHLAVLRWDRVHNGRFPVPGAFGRGWSSWADVRLEVDDRLIRYVGPDGQVVVIGRRDDGAWDAPSSLAATLVEVGSEAEGDGSVTGADGVRSGFELRWLDGQVWSFTGAGALVGLRTDEAPATACTFERDDRGRLIAITSARGPSLHVRWSGERVVATVGMDGSVASYRYDDAGDLIVVDAPVLVRCFEVDAQGRIVTVVDGDGVVLAANTYDEAGRVVAQRQPHGRTSVFRYLPGLATVLDDRDGQDSGPRTVFHHDLAGRLTATVDAYGQRQTIERDDDGNPVRTVDRLGRVTVRSFDEAGRCVRRIEPDGGEWTTTYDELGRVVGVTGPNGATTTLAYDGPGRWPARIVDPLGAVMEATVVGGDVVRVVDADGVALTFEHDARGQIVAVTDALGHTQRIERDGAGRIVAVATPSGHVTRCRYDERGDVVERVDPDGSTWRFMWTAAGRPASMTEPDGAVTRWRYGAHGDVVAQVGPLGAEVTFDHDRWGHLTRITGVDGAKWDLEYDGLGQLVRRSDPAGGVELRAYDAEGSLTEVVDGLGATTNVGWAPDELGGGWVGTTIDAVGSVSVTRADALGRVVEQFESDGAAWRYEHDLAGRVVAVTDPTGATTRFEHSPGGRLVRRTSPMGAVTEWRHDEAGQVVAVVDPNGAVTSLRRNGEGWVTRVEHPTGEVETFGHDAMGRVVEHHRPDGSVARRRFDHRGNVVRATSGTGGERRYRYDLTGALVEAVDANGSSTRYERDEQGRVVAVVDPAAEVTRYEHDEVGRVVAVVDPLGRRTGISYDRAGRVREVRRTDGADVVIVRDACGRVTARSDGDGVSLIDRDRAGRPVRVVGPTGEVTFAYDQLGRLVQRCDGQLSIGWRYDADGRRTAFVHPDGTETSYVLDPAGRLVAVTHPAAGRATFVRDAMGRAVAYQDPVQQRFWSYVGGHLARYEVARDGRSSVTTLERDGDGRVVVASVDGRSVSYAYDAAGQLVAAGDRRFGYDRRGRLVSESVGSGAVGSGAVGSESGGSGSTGGPRRGRAGAGGRGSVSSVLATYDASGALVARVGHGVETTFGFDSLGRRTSAVARGAATGEVVADVRYRWSASDQLVSAVDAVSGVERSLRYDAAGSLAAIDDGRVVLDPTAGVPQLRQLGDRLVFGAGSPLALVGGGGDGGIEWLGLDWQGSVGDGFDPWGASAVAGGIEGGAFGLGPSPRNEVGLGFRSELDLGLGALTVLGARAYDASTRSFLSPDPVGPDAGGPTASTPYHYCDNDPVNLVDPSGRHPLTNEEYRQFREDERKACLTGSTLVLAGAMVSFVPGVGPMAGGALMGMGFNMYAQNQWPPDAKELAVSGVIGGAAGGMGALGGKVGGQAGSMVFGEASSIARPATSGLTAGFSASTTNELGNAVAGRGFHPMNIVLGTATGGTLAAAPGTVGKLRGWASEVEARGGLNTRAWGDRGGTGPSPHIELSDVVGKTRDEVRALAAEKGLQPFGLPDAAEGLPRKWKDPVTRQERLRLDRGHINPRTGEPFDHPTAAVDHSHLYEPNGHPVADPLTGDRHFPTSEP